MKIFAITGNNPGASLPPAQLGSPLVWAMLPDSCIIHDHNGLYLPDLAHNYDALPVLVMKCCRLGKSVPARFAHRYVSEITAVLLIRDLTRLDALQQASLPWAMALGFDRSLITGSFVTAGDGNALGKAANAAIETVTSEGLSVRWDSSALRIDPAHIVECVSQDNTLKHGDLIICDMPPQCAIPLRPGMTLTATIDGCKVLETKIK